MVARRLAQVKKRWWILIALLLLFAGAAVIWKPWTERRSHAVVIDSTVVDRGTVERVLLETGIIKSKVGSIVKIGSRATGVIQKMHVRVGSQVSRGDLIAQIDDREIRANIEQLEEELRAARARQEKVRTVYPLTIQEAEKRLDAARARWAYLQSNRKRQEKLLEGNVVSDDAVEKVRQEEEVARADVEAAHATLKRAKEEFARELTLAEADVASKEAQLEREEVRLTYTQIHSPLTGLVSQVNAQEGETIVAGLQVANLITVIDPMELEMWIYVDETDIGSVKPGQTVTYLVDAYPERSFRGEIVRIYPEPEIRDNIVYYLAIVDISREDASALKPSMTTQARITVTTREDVLRVPNAAIKWVRNKQVIYRVREENEPDPVAALLGIHGESHTEIVQGLAEGERVALKMELPEGSPPQTRNRR